MAKPTIRITLEDGTGTWLVVAPIKGADHYAAISAAGEAFSWFIANLIRDQDAVAAHLSVALESE